MNIQESGSIEEIKKRLEEIVKTRILVGIPEDSESAEQRKKEENEAYQKHTDEFIREHNITDEKKIKKLKNRKINDLTNAQKLFINSRGSPATGMPARPVLEPAIQDKFDKISEKIREGAIKGLEGDMEGFREDYEIAGLMAQTASINWFDNPKNNWAPNAERTIKAKGSDSPLIDTGEMRKAITYAVVKGNKL
jgi:hypothetical protein